MTFALKPNETLTGSIRRICGKCVRRALRNSASKNMEAIHATRKEIKRLRAVLRLVRKETSKNRSERILDQLRHAARCLASPRDAYVKLRTLDQFGKSTVARSETEAFKLLRAQLRQRCVEETERFCRVDGPKAVCRSLRRARHHLAALRLKQEGWGAVQSGVRKTYRNARKSLAAARGARKPEKFHDFRKAVKDLGYQLQLLRPIAPRQIDRQTQDLERLGDLLGNDHDLHMLGLELVQIGNDLPRAMDSILSLVEDRQTKLRRAAVTLGTRLFHQRPGDFTEQLHRLWSVWRLKGKQHAKIPQRVVLKKSARKGVRQQPFRRVVL